MAKKTCIFVAALVCCQILPGATARQPSTNVLAPTPCFSLQECSPSRLSEKQERRRITISRFWRSGGRSQRNLEMPFSPSSAGEGDSPAGSPDTRLTAPSPNEPAKRSAVSPKNQGIIDRDGSKAEERITQFRLEQQRERGKDPFVTPGRASKSGLSPTASAFSPFHVATENPDHTSIHIPVNTLSQSMGMSRWLKIVAEQIVTPQQVKAWLQVGDYEFGTTSAAANEDKELESDVGSFHGARRVLERNGIMGIFFEDIRDAWLFQSQTSSARFGWQVIYVSYLGLGNG